VPGCGAAPACAASTAPIAIASRALRLFGLMPSLLASLRHKVSQRKIKNYLSSKEGELSLRKFFLRVVLLIRSAETFATRENFFRSAKHKCEKPL
jgi:hypothetical protein